MQPPIAIDQFINTLIPAKHEGLGYADETISARCWRLRADPTWERVRQIIDALLAPSQE